MSRTNPSTRARAWWCTLPLLLAACGGAEEPEDPSTTTDTSSESTTSTVPELEPWQEPLAVGEIRNVLLVTLDTTRADHLACYGSTTSSTPRIDHLAATGVRFDQAFSTAPITLPSHASLMTGLYPFRHGARNNGTHRLPEDVVTLAEVLSENGYQTGAVISAMVLHERYGLAQGFDDYDQDLVAGSFRPAYLARETPAADTARRALTWLGGVERTDPWFLWVHFFDPHHPYTPPPGYAERCAGNPYDGEIAYADEQLGVLLDTLRARGELKDTLVVVAGDHGESLGEHGESTHSVFIYDAVLRVPLIFSHPALPQASVVHGQASLVDVMPTVVDLLGLPGVDQRDGTVLSPVLRGEVTLPDRLIYAESMLPYYNLGWSDLRAVRAPMAKFIEAPQPEMYALAADPGEIVNVIEDNADQADILRQRLAELLADGERDALLGLPEDLPPGQRAALEALGYAGLSGGAADESADEGAAAGEDAERPDPKDRMRALENQLEALNLARRGDPGAEQALRAVLAQAPDAHRVKSALVDLLSSEQRFEEALPLARDLADLPAATSSEVLGLAQIERALGKPEWEARIEAAKALDPDDPAPHLLEGAWDVADGNLPQAIDHFDRALEIDPGNLLALIRKGRAQRAAAMREDARATLERALAINPNLYPLQMELGYVAVAQARFPAAAAHFQTATTLDPTQMEAWRRAGSALLRIGRQGKALAAFEQASALGDLSVPTQRGLGTLSFQAGRYAVAAEALARTLEQTPNDAQSLLILAACQEELGRSEEAQATLARARAVDADQVEKLRPVHPLIGQLLNRYPAE